MGSVKTVKQPLRREDSGLSALHEILQSQEIEVVGELPAISAAMMERRRASVAMSAPVGTAMLQRRGSRRWVAWIAILLGVGAAGLLAHALGAL